MAASSTPNITCQISNASTASAIPVGQTDRMMTEAEALQTLAREDPAVADDAQGRAALARPPAAAWR